MKSATLIALFHLVTFALAIVSQKEILEFLAQHGEELVTKTEDFLHEQRRLGHEDQLHILERNIIEVENLAYELRNLSTVVNHTDDEQVLHDIHQLEYRLFAAENVVTEEMLKITLMNEQRLTTVSTVSSVTQSTGTTPTHVTSTPFKCITTTTPSPNPTTPHQTWTTWSPNRTLTKDPKVLKAYDVLDRVGEYYCTHPAIDASTKTRIENEVTVVRQLIYNIVDLRNNNVRYIESLEYHANFLTNILDELH